MSAASNLHDLRRLPLRLEAYEKACLERALEENEGDVMSLPKLMGEPDPWRVWRLLWKHRLPGVKECQHRKLRPMETCAACNAGIDQPMSLQYK